MLAAALKGKLNVRGRGRIVSSVVEHTLYIVRKSSALCSVAQSNVLAQYDIVFNIVTIHFN